jgi:hypothetical protein
MWGATMARIASHGSEKEFATIDYCISPSPTNWRSHLRRRTLLLRYERARFYCVNLHTH